MFISEAWAQSAGGAPGSGLGMFVPMLLVVAIFYFLLIRPQQKRAKEHKKMVENIGKGDRIVAAGGLIGKVAKVVDEREIDMELKDGTVTAIIRDSITTVLETKSKGGSTEKGGKAPTKANAKKKAEEEASTEKKSLKERFDDARNAK